MGHADLFQMVQLFHDLDEDDQETLLSSPSFKFINHQTGFRFVCLFVCFSHSCLLILLRDFAPTLPIYFPISNEKATSLDDHSLCCGVEMAVVQVYEGDSGGA